MHLFFDTETTGRPKNPRAQLYDLDNWPRLVQIAWLKYEDNGKLLSSESHIIKPEGFEIPVDATRIHGITTYKANSIGQDLKTVLQNFSNLIDEANFIIAHNMSFDEKIVGAEFIRKRVDHALFQKERICTMEKTTNFCSIDKPSGGGYKWPKLAELYHKLFETSFEEAHDAAVDAQATAKCFWELKRRRII